MSFNKVNLISFVAFGVGGFVLVIGAAMAGFGNAKVPHRDYDPFFDGSYENYEKDKSSGKRLAIAGYVFITIGVIAVVVSMSVRCYVMSGGFKNGHTAVPGVTTYNTTSTIYTGPASGGYQTTGSKYPQNAGPGYPPPSTGPASGGYQNAGSNYPQNAGPGYPPPSTHPPVAYPNYPNPSEASKYWFQVFLKSFFSLH